MADDFVVHNPSASPVYLTSLGVEVPPTDDVDLLEHHTLATLVSNPDLVSKMALGTLRRRVAGVLLPIGDPLSMVGPVAVAQQSKVGPVLLSVLAPGQTAFTLPFTPVDPESVYIQVNGIVAVRGLDFNVVGTSVTWMNRLFTLDPSDEVAAGCDIGV